MPRFLIYFIVIVGISFGIYFFIFSSKNSSIISETSTFWVTKDGYNISKVTSQNGSNENFDQAYNTQKAFLDVLKNEAEIDIKNIYISSISIEGNKASLALNEVSGGGAVAFMYKTDKGWRFISAGQGMPSCTEMEARQVPKEYWNCY